MCNEDDTLDIFDFELDCPSKLVLIVKTELKLIKLSPSVALPEIHLLAEYLPEECDVQGEHVPVFNVSISYIEHSNTEWLLSFILPIVEWRNQLMETFHVLFRLKPKDNQFSFFEMIAEVNTPRFPPALKRILGIFGTESWINEGLLLAEISSSAVAKDFKVLFQKDHAGSGDQKSSSIEN